MTLDEVVQNFDDMQPGDVVEVSENFCKHCRSTDLAVNISLEAVPGSLAGVQVKTNARKIAVLECRGCGRVSGS
jgi:hypothetical protein